MIEYLTNPPQLNLHHSLPFIQQKTGLEADNPQATKLGICCKHSHKSKRASVS